ncbi:MAG: response regulator [Nitrospirae bacterium]|nr:response regulator [Nitrospirota bacterium]
MKRLILIVDDSASVRQLVGLTLVNAGYEVLEAVDGGDALAKLDELVKLKDKKVDMMFVDINMPNMNGLEFVIQARQLHAYRFIPIIMLTTEAHVSRRQEGKLAGATGWIIKPFKPEQLLNLLTKFLA